MSRVLLWSETFWPRLGGAELLGVRLTQALVDRGHEITVVVPEKDHHERLPCAGPGFEIHRMRFALPPREEQAEWLFESRRRVSRLCRELAPDLIHFWTVGTSAFFHLSESTIPSLVTLHGEFPSEHYASHTVLGRLLRRASWVNAVSASALEHAGRFVPLRGRSSAVPNALPPPRERPDLSPTGPPTVLCLGRLEADKGFDVALRAFPGIVSACPSAHLLLAGDGSERAGLEALARELGIADRVSFLGWVPPGRVPRLMNRARVVLMPSRTEAFGLVALQAAQMARPLVAARTGGLRDLVVHGETGLLVAPGNADELGDAVVELLRSPSRTALLGAAARERALERFGWDRCVEAYEDLYARVANGGSDVADA